MKKKVVSFLVSGRGSNFTVIAEKIKSGAISAEFGAVISNKPDAQALDAARSLGIPAYVVKPKDFFTRKGHEKEIIRILEKHNTDLVIAAGYMRILSSYIIRRFRFRIMNIHPALLPAFPGMAAQRQAIDYGVRFSGCTVHFIDEGTDTGPIILQRTVPVLETDTPADLSKRILDQEHEAFPAAVSLFCQDRLEVIGRKVKIK
jgi:phosphoribosylglycinamide formyltransferase-1